METPDELRGFLAGATQDGVWNRLLYRGAAWTLMREDGVLPDNAPPLGATIETDLNEHGFSVLRAALALREKEGPSELFEPRVTILFHVPGTIELPPYRSSRLETPAFPRRGFYLADRPRLTAGPRPDLTQLAGAIHIPLR